MIPFNDYVTLGNKIYYEKDIISLLKCFNQAGEYTLEYVLDWFYKNKQTGLWTEYERIIKDNGAIVLFANGMFTADLMQSNRKIWKYNLIWEKTQPTGFLNAKRMPLRAHEDICIFYKNSPTYNPQKTTGHVRKISKAEHKVGCKETTDYGKHGLTTYDSTERYPRSVLKFAKDIQKCAIHPTQKPAALIEWLIKTYTNPGDVVLDSCAGSMTTGVAAINTGRKYICIEKEKDMCEMGKKRIGNAVIEREKNRMKEKLKQALMDYFEIGDSYTYNLTRVKDAFEVGTMSLNDFDEFTEENVDDIVDFLWKRLGNDNPSITLTSNESYDWQILKCNNGFKTEGHTMNEIEWIRLLLSLGYKVEQIEISDEEMEKMC